MKVKHTPKAFELALIASVLCPKTARKDPWFAAQLASRLVAAAQDVVDGLSRSEGGIRRLNAWCDQESQKIPVSDQLPLADAFQKIDHSYATLPRFSNALRKAGLISYDKSGEEITTEESIKEFLDRPEERRKAKDRCRKPLKGRSREKTRKNRSRKIAD